MPSGEGTGQSSGRTSGFVDHLRLVHFTICVTCFIAIVAITSQTASSASRAYDQANLLLKLADKWRAGKWLNEFAAQYGMANAEFGGLLEVEGESAVTMVFRPARRTQFGWVALAKKDDAYTALKTDPTDTVNTVADAERVWNMLNEFRYVMRPTQVHNGWLIKPDGSISEAKLNQGQAAAVSVSAKQSSSRPIAQPGETIRSARLLLRSEFADSFGKGRPELRDAVGKMLQSRRVDAYFISVELPRRDEIVTRPGVWILPADCITEVVSLQTLLGASIIPPEFLPGDFKHSFPDASELAKNLKTLSLAELQAFFQTERDRTGDKIEFPLVKLPAESVAYWGTATIFMLTVYWFAVFRDFRLRLLPGDNAWNAPWIGISGEFWSKRLFIATTLLPPTAAAYLILFGMRQLTWGPRIALMVGVFVLVAIPILGIVHSWLCIQRMDPAGSSQQRVPNSPPQRLGPN
jgi:hypothetical protein